MPILVESRRRQKVVERLRLAGASIVDVTSKGAEPWVRFSPFYPHGNIPIPHSPGIFAQSVEGLWQGLKVFEHEDIDPRKWAITNLTNIKRSGKSRGAVKGHRFGVGSSVLLDYREARRQIYLPAYRWILDHHLSDELEKLRLLMAGGSVVLLDYETSADIEDLSRPLSHAALIQYYLEEVWPGETQA